MNKLIIILFIALFLVLVCSKNNNEAFADYIDKMGYNNKTIQLFCKKCISTRCFIFWRGAGGARLPFPELRSKPGTLLKSPVPVP